MRRAVLLFPVLAYMALEAKAAEPHVEFSSPIIDRKIFREGQVERLTGQFGDWVVMCDDVKSLRRRYCSLRSSKVSGSRGGFIYVDVSTGDDGRPAALIHLPLGVSIAPGVTIEVGAVSPSKRNARKPHEIKRRRHVREIAACSSSECLSVWTLSAEEVASLVSGEGLTIAYCLLPASSAEFDANLSNKSCAVRSVIDLPSLGFQAAVNASIK